jgi:NifU-like protein involved in Fe-S cluster formation
MAAISELLCDVTVLTQGNHGNQFTAQVQIDEKKREIEVAQRGCGQSMVSSDWSA